MRAKKRAEERQARQDAKVAKDEQRRQEDLKSYKNIMKVGTHGTCHRGRRGAGYLGAGERPLHLQMACAQAPLTDVQLPGKVQGGLLGDMSAVSKYVCVPSGKELGKLLA